MIRINKIWSKLLIVSFAAVSLTSCVKDPTALSSVGNNKIQVLFTIPDQVPGSYATVGALPSEREFDEAYVIFYDASGNYVAHTSSTTASNSSVGSFEVVKPAEVEVNKQYKLLVVANLKHYLDNTKYASTNDYLSDKSGLKYDIMRSDMSAMSTNRISNYLPMYAESDVTISESSVISVIFERSVARFDLVNLAQNLDIEWVKVCNYSKEGYFFHNEYNVIGSSIINGAGINDMESTPHTVSFTRRTEMEDPSLPQSNDKGGLYSFPNINTSTGVNDLKTTCLLIKGIYSYTDEDGSAKTKDSYYRVNICAPGRPQNLKRNSIYRITVKSVSDGGLDNEDEAMNSKTIKIDYEISNWDVDNSQEVITDSDGNYLIVNPTSAYIGGGKNSFLTGGVKVKNSLPWTIEKLVTGDSWFSVAKTTDNNGFTLTALVDNTTSNIRSSKVRVKVTGTTLQYDIFVYQYSKSISDDAVLIVDGRMGDFSLDVNGNGQTHKLQVILGANSANATMTLVSGDGSMIQTSNPAIGTPGIGNNSVLNILFRANTTGKERSSVYKIVRKNAGNADITTQITFKQPITTQTIITSPGVIFSENSVDGFMNLTGAANYNKCQSQRVYVTSLNATTYPKWRATSTFNTYDVALITKPTAITSTYPAGSVLTNVATGSSDEYFDIAVARCGPGDEPITGTITIETCNSSGTPIGGFKHTIPLTVYSSLNSGFTQIDTTMWHDRNVGTPESNIGDESKITIRALPFSNYTKDYRSADKTGAYRNKSFAGTYHSFAETNYDPYDRPASQLCPPGWRVPVPNEITTVVSRMQWSKSGHRPYIVANTGENKNIKGCYFPMNGYLVSPVMEVGIYWTNYGGGPVDYHYMLLDPTSASLTTIHDSPNIGGSTVRCVKRGI